jgi:hypothetical protein
MRLGPGKVRELRVVVEADFRRFFLKLARSVFRARCLVLLVCGGHLNIKAGNRQTYPGGGSLQGLHVSSPETGKSLSVWR